MLNRRRQQSGFTLIEMVVAIVVLGIGVAGVLATYTSSVRNSSNALVSKQLVAIAEGMMEEILLKPFGPNPGAGAAGLAACGAAGANRAGFDDVADYNTYQTNDICGIDGVAIAGLAGYGVAVTVVPVAWQGIGAADVLQVQVTATRLNQAMVLNGVRTNYARFPPPP